VICWVLVSVKCLWKFIVMLWWLFSILWVVVIWCTMLFEWVGFDLVDLLCLVIEVG